MPVHNPYDGEVIHNPEASRFEIQIDRQVAVLQYRMHGDTILFTHTARARRSWRDSGWGAGWCTQGWSTRAGKA